MATRFDNIFRPLAQRLIDDTFGTSATLRRTTPSYDVATGVNTPVAVDYAITISPPAPVRASRIAGVVEAGDARCLVAAASLSVTPRTEDLFLWDGDTWQIVEVNAIVSGDQKAAFELIVRK